MSIKKWNISKESTLFKKGMINITEMESIREQDNKKGVFYRFNFTDWVNVIPVTSDGKLLLVKQWRHGTEDISIEIPGGLSDPDELPEESAIRELREETGYTSEDWIYLGAVRPNPAIQTNKCHIYLALDAKLTDKTDFDPDEELETLEISFEEADIWVSEGRITNAITLAAFSLLKSKYAGRGIK